MARRESTQNKGRKPPTAAQLRKAIEEARKLAREAHEENFAIRRDVGIFYERPWVYLYDNNPYAAPGRREVEHAQLRDRLADLGLSLIGVSRYPFAGEGAECTIGAVLQVEDGAAVADAAEKLANAWRAIRDASDEGAKRFHRPRPMKGRR